MKTVAIMYLALTAAIGQAQISDVAAEKAKMVTVMINSTIDSDTRPGAGIVFALANGQVYIATANHLVRKNTSEANDIRVEFRWLPGQPFPAQLLTKYDPSLDLAVMVVDGNIAHARNSKMALDRLGDPSKLLRDADVWAIGYPDGTAYDLDGAKFNTLEGIRLQCRVSGLVPGGYSGGPLVDGNGRIVGMLVKDQPPNAVATRIDLILDQLKAWSYQVDLRVPDSTEDSRTWKDPSTGLEWTSYSTDSVETWKQANEFCQEMPKAGLGQWRLPTADELKGIYNPNVNVPGTHWKYSEVVTNQGYHEKHAEEIPWSWHVNGNLRLHGYIWSSTPNPHASPADPPSALAFNFTLGSTYPYEFDDLRFTVTLCVRNSGN